MMTTTKIKLMSMLWKNGVPVKQIARAAYCAPTTVYHLAQHNRDMFPRRRRKPAVCDEDTKLSLVERVKSGELSANAAAKECGASRTTVSRWVREMG